MPTNPHTQLNLVIHQHEYGTSTYVRDDTADDEDFDIEQFVSKHGIDFDEDREELILQTIDLPKHEVLVVSVNQYDSSGVATAVYLDGNLIISTDYQDDGNQYIDEVAASLSSLFGVEIKHESLLVSAHSESPWDEVSKFLSDQKSIAESSQDDDNESTPSL